MVSGLTVLLVVLGAHAALWLFAARGSKHLQTAGPFVLLKTTAGRDTLERLGRNSGRARILGDLFLTLTLLGAVFILFFLVFNLKLTFDYQRELAETPPRVQDALLIPGVNEAVPLTYGLFALLVALVIHEGGHGVLAMATGMGVRSVGLLFLGIPIGAFVEPDEGKMLRSTLRDRLRLFSAGPGPNLVLGLACFAAFGLALVPALQPSDDGVAVLGTTPELPAARAGLPAGAFVTALQPEGSQRVQVSDLETVTEVLNGTAAGRPLIIHYRLDGTPADVTVVPIDRGDYIREQAPQAYHSWMDGKAFLGVSFAGPDELRALSLRLGNPYRAGPLLGTLDILSRPFQGVAPFPPVFKQVYEPTGLAANLGATYWITADTLYFLFWINILLGTFNALPLAFLDGGQMMRHTLTHVAFHRRGLQPSNLDVVEKNGRPQLTSNDPETARSVESAYKAVDRWQLAIGAVLLTMLLFPFIYPRFL